MHKLKFFCTDTVQDTLQSIRFLFQFFFPPTLNYLSSTINKGVFSEAKSHFKNHQMQLHLKADLFLFLKELLTALYCRLSNT